MPSHTSRLALTKIGPGDPIDLDSQFGDNWDRLDAQPGIVPCFSNSRPTWGSNQAGQFIFERDTKLMWFWTGSAWERSHPKGLLGLQSQTSGFTTSSGTYQTALQISVVVPAGGRTIRVSASYSRVENDDDPGNASILRLYRSTGGGKELQHWWETGKPTRGEAQDFGRGRTMEAWDDTVAAGTHTYMLQLAVAIGGSSSIKASASAPYQLAIHEV